MTLDHRGALANENAPFCFLSFSKREYGRRKVFRRRAAPSPAVIEPEADRAQVVDSEGQSTLANIAIPGLRRHRQLKNRSRLWSFF